jgi:hypothetical protein
MIDAGGAQLVAWWALVLLLVLPVWWAWRRRRFRPAIVFSRTASLAAGSPAGRAVTYVRYTDLFRWPLALAILAQAAELLLAARRGPLP